MARTTKEMVIKEMDRVFDEFETVTNELFRLVEEKKVNTGVLLTLTRSSSYPFQWLYGLKDNMKSKLYGKQRHETKVSEYRMMLNWAQEDLQKAKDFLNDKTQVGWRVAE